MPRDEDNGFADWGGYFEAKKSKLEEQFAAASDPFRKSNLFDGISIFVNGRTNPSADELKRIMMVHGGTFHHYERSHTRFIIASNLPDVKVRKMDTSKIISAQWVVDCLEQKRVLDYKPYLLYTNQKTTQPRINFGKGKSNNSTVNETAGQECGTLENDLGGILKELQQAVSTSPDKNASSVINVSATTANNSHSARTAVDPAFLSEFYKNSRLHHIATLGAGFKQYVCELRQAHGNKPFEKRLELLAYLASQPKPMMEFSSKRYVMHIDMDCFFVSVGLCSYPELRNQPVAVTHSKGGSAATDVPVHPQANRQVEQELFAQRFEKHLHDNVLADKVRGGFDKKMSLSEIASCSYEARAKGVRNGMFVGQALKLCPDLKTIPYDFDGYRQVAFALYDTVAQYTLDIEAVSCDEMFVDLTNLLQDLQVDVMTFVTYLRRQVRDSTFCPCSAGVGENKLLARMATKLAKPNGQHLLETDDAANYMAPLALNVLPGVGSSMTYKLNQAGMMTCADVQKTSLSRLEMLLGKKVAQTLYQNCRGIDPRPLVYEQQRKSVSAEVNYGIRFTKYEELEKFLEQLSEEVHNRLTEIKRKTKSITLKLMVRAAEAPVETSKYMGHGVCDNQTKSSLLKQSTDDVQIIKFHVLKLMKESGFPPHELRGIGIHLSKLDDVKESKKENVIKNMFEKISVKQKEKPAHVVVTSKESEVQTKPKPATTNVLNMLRNAASSKKPRVSEPISKDESTITNDEEMIIDVDDDLEVSKPQPTVFSMLKDAAARRSNNPSNLEDASDFKTIAPAAVSQFDSDVLDQLPEDIRREILSFPEEYLRISEKEEPKKLKPFYEVPFDTPESVTSSPAPSPFSIITVSSEFSPLSESDLQPSTSKAALSKQMERACRPDKIVADYVQELPQHMHPAILHYLKNNETIPKILSNEMEDVFPVEELPTPNSPKSPEFNVFMDSNYRDMLSKWVKTDLVPNPADVNLMYTHICFLVEDNLMDDVYEVMKYLCRLIKAKRPECCRWHMAYNEIESNIQEKVYEVYDCHIYFTEVIGCYKCT